MLHETDAKPRHITLDIMSNDLLTLASSSPATSETPLSHEYASDCSTDLDVGDIRPSDGDCHSEEVECIKAAEETLRKCLVQSKHLATFQVQELLGYGTFGIVVKGRQGLMDVAIKIMSLVNIAEYRYCIDPGTQLKSLTEIVMLKYLKHEGIIEYFDSWHDQEYFYLVTGLGGRPWLCSVNDHCAISDGNNHLDPVTKLDPCCLNDRSMAGLLRSCGGLNFRGKGRLYAPVIQPLVQKKVFSQLVGAVAFLHAKGIFHGDLKDENVLIDETYKAQVIDFGHASFYSVNDLNPPVSDMYATYGTKLFCSPEIRSGKRYRGPEADVYALGLMLYEMQYGDLPDALLTAYYVPGGTCVFDFDASCGFLSPLVVDLCRAMLSPDPDTRPDITAVAGHQWFST